MGGFGRGSGDGDLSQSTYALPVNDAIAVGAFERAAKELGWQLTVADRTPDMDVASYRLICTTGPGQVEIRLKQRAEALTEIRLEGELGDTNRLQDATERLAPTIREEDLFG